jgi:Ca-activated chloride channel family protein
MDLSPLASFHFLHPAWLLALPPLLLLSARRALRRARDGSWSRIVDAQLLPLLRVSQARRGHSPWMLLGVIWTLAVLALAGPAWRHEQSSAFRVPAAWVVVLELSPSMNARDVAPDRVTRARYAVADILSAAQDARVGLVAYAGEPHTVAPLTSDVATVRLLLQPLSPGLMPEPGDALAPALEEADGLLRAAAGAHRQVIVLADGSGDVAESLRTARRLAERGITVNIVGVGTEAGAPSPGGRGEFARDSQGALKMTRMQSDALKRIAVAGGGLFVPLAQLPGLLHALQAHRAGPLEAGEATNEQVGHWRNEGVWMLPPLLLLSALLARRGWV